MQIRTITSGSTHIFDETVNRALSNGYQLVRRDVLVNTVRVADSILYAELVLPDPAPEPETIDPLDLLRQVQEFCHNVPAGNCCTDKCPLHEWCQQLRNGGDPTDWDLPEVLQE